MWLLDFLVELLQSLLAPALVIHTSSSAWGQCHPDAFPSTHLGYRKLHPCPIVRQECTCCCHVPLQLAPCFRLLQWWSGTLLCASTTQVRFPQELSWALFWWQQAWARSFGRSAKVGWVYFRYQSSFLGIIPIYEWFPWGSSPPNSSQETSEYSKLLWIPFQESSLMNLCASLM